MDGGRVAEELKADAELRKIPVIFLTAIVSRDEVQTHAGSIGGQLFIAKPVSMEEMLASIERQIRQPSDSGAAVNGAARAS
ncbi:MAG: hypothetical protein HY597_00060 [Candidatus Omnitrophica bacterium]|nr:hypothetical protein [Candidatus Omnitrophota bacterium]